MNASIRSLIDEIFSEMKMTQENLALRDELMANAQAHFEDAVAKGASEEQALAEVASSLGDVQALLAQMNAEAPKAAPKKQRPAPFWSALEQEKQDAEAAKAEKAEEEKPASDLEDAFGKAMDALGDFGRESVRQTRRLARKVDSATGGVMSDFGRAVGKGVMDVTRAAGSAIEQMTRGKDEAVEEQPEAEAAEAQAPKEEESPDALRRKALAIRAEAELKQAAGNQEGARDMRREAYQMELRADALEQEAALRAAQEAARAATEAAAQAEEDVAIEVEIDVEEPERAPEGEAPEAPKADEAEKDWLGEDGSIDPEAFQNEVDDLTRQATEAAREAQGAAFTMDGAAPGTVFSSRYAAAGLRLIDAQLDADDITVERGSGDSVEVEWTAGENGGDAPEITLQDRALTIRRRNPDFFKTFFSVFSKDGGRLTLRVPAGYGLAYKLNTTSGDVTFGEVDVDELDVNTSSGVVRVIPDTDQRAKAVRASSLSGPVTLSACAETVEAKTVSGDIFVSCDAAQMNADTKLGHLHVEGAMDSLEAHTVSGDAELLCTVVPTGKVTLGSMTAQIRLALPGDIRGFVVTVSGPSASVVNEFGPNRYGTCALPIRLETLSGKLIVAKL